MTVSVETQSDKRPNKQRFISLRVRLLVGFTVIFTGVFSAAYYWFYVFTMESAIASLRKDLNQTLEGAAAGIDVDELIALYEDGEPNADGFSDDPRYLSQLAWFETVQQLEPRAWPYSSIMVGLLGHDTARVQTRESGEVSVKAAPVDNEAAFVGLVDLWALHEPEHSYVFLDLGTSSQYSVRAFQEGRLVERPDLYEDEWGEWFSSYVPLLNSSGETVGILGLDFEASYVNQLKRSLVNQILFSFAIAYIILFTLVYASSVIFTRPLQRLSASAHKIANAEYDDTQALKELSGRVFYDEFANLADVFLLMISKVKGREETLKKKVKTLEIEIDEARKRHQVKEIVDSEFFQELQQKAAKLRQRFQEDDNQD